jgi:MFS family permease
MQLPSNIALDFFGGPMWISFICLTWGAVAAGFAGIKNEATFLALRFLLGIFEAGAFPGMLFYVSMFYPRNRTQLPMTSLVSTPWHMCNYLQLLTVQCSWKLVVGCVICYGAAGCRARAGGNWVLVGVSEGLGFREDLGQAESKECQD